MLGEVVPQLVSQGLGQLQLRALSDGDQAALGLVEAHQLFTSLEALMAPLDGQPLATRDALKLVVQLDAGVGVQHWNWDLRQWLTVGLAVIEHARRSEEGDLTLDLLAGLLVDLMVL